MSKNCIQVQIAGNPVFKKRRGVYGKKKRQNKSEKKILKGSREMPQIHYD